MQSCTCRVVSKEKHVEVETALKKGMRLNYFPLLHNALRYIERMHLEVHETILNTAKRFTYIHIYSYKLCEGYLSTYIHRRHHAALRENEVLREVYNAQWTLISRERIQVSTVGRRTCT